MNEQGVNFIPGLDLCERFYWEAVQPILAQNFPDLTVSAALLVSGSEVLGFDTPQSMDHDWGPRVMLFLAEADYPQYRDKVDSLLQAELPAAFLGFPMGPEVSIHPAIAIFTIRGFFQDTVHINVEGDITPLDWILVPQQQLLGVTAGRVFSDPAGKLEAARLRLAYYPQDVWLYLLEAQWMRISQEEHFMGRCGQVGDELGSRLVAARLVKDLMNLGFLIERKYAPYIKWFGTAFQRLSCAEGFSPLFGQVLAAESWQARQEPLAQALELAAHLHNGLGITEALPAETGWFYERPFKVIRGERFAAAIRHQIKDPQVLRLPEHLGGVDQFIDSTDAVNTLNRRVERIKQFLKSNPA